MGLSKAVFINMDEKNKVSIPVSFNPTTYTIDRSNNLREVGNIGGVNQDIDFMWQNMDSMNLELFIDTTSTGDDARIPAYRIIRLANIDQNTGNFPRLMFVWGNLAFSCVMEKVSQHYEQFTSSGWPLRARLTVSLRGYDSFDDARNKTYNEPKDYRTGTAGPSKTLSSAAAQSGRDHRDWRHVAGINKITNPLTVKPGTKLILPG